MENGLMALTDFSYESVGVRVLGTQLEPWFVATDVLAALDIHEKNVSRVVKTLDDDEKLVVKLTTNSAGNPDVWLVSEPGLYKIMLRSRTQKAEKFTRFVTHEVLPSIRKYGYYKVPKPVKEKRPLGRPPLALAEYVEHQKKYELANGEKCDITDLRIISRELGLPVEKIRDAWTSNMVEFVNEQMAARGIESIEGISWTVDCASGDEPDETYTIIVDGVPVELVR